MMAGGAVPLFAGQQVNRPHVHDEAALLAQQAAQALHGGGAAAMPERVAGGARLAVRRFRAGGMTPGLDAAHHGGLAGAVFGGPDAHAQAFSPWGLTVRSPFFPPASRRIISTVWRHWRCACSAIAAVSRFT